ncbi:hypothetical protein P154DRAFT_617582 [Amniculicola lignicola CBS 123094]|uniref:Uncharacterized protein n=1 Tax=Amniculicola lignicola CBS 123094 TaxID=1392246 RepID=A0A6A5WSA7_9PLEO|nr:hypothetical protein P154DRAFT_617582 [Amniculicola lignicola CBS 123094]
MPLARFIRNWIEDYETWLYDHDLPDSTSSSESPQDCSSCSNAAPSTTPPTSPSANTLTTSYFESDSELQSEPDPESEPEPEPEWLHEDFISFNDPLSNWDMYVYQSYMFWRATESLRDGDEAALSPSNSSDSSSSTEDSEDSSEPEWA